jgi:hypothetical protein
MPSGDVALRFSVVFAVAGFIIMAAGTYEIDRRKKSSSETVTTSLTGIEQRVLILSDQIRIMNDQYTREINTNERQLHSSGRRLALDALASLRAQPGASSQLSSLPVVVLRAGSLNLAVLKKNWDCAE